MGTQWGERATMSGETLNIMARSDIEKDYGTFREIVNSCTELTSPMGGQGGRRVDMSGHTLNIMARSKIEKDYGKFR